jgi:hypothetical protein
MDEPNIFVENGIKYKVNRDNKTLTLVGLEENLEQLEIPETVRGMDVITIGSHSLYKWNYLPKRKKYPFDPFDCRGRYPGPHPTLKKLTISKKIRHIHDNALPPEFGYHNYVFIPGTVKTIGVQEMFDGYIYLGADENTQSYKLLGNKTYFNVKEIFRDNDDYHYFLSNNNEIVLTKFNITDKTNRQLPGFVDDKKVTIYDLDFGIKNMKRVYMVPDTITHFKTTGIQESEILLVRNGYSDSHNDKYIVLFNKIWEDKSIDQLHKLIGSTMDVSYGFIDKKIETLIVVRGNEYIFRLYLGDKEKVEIPDYVTSVYPSAFQHARIETIKFTENSMCVHFDFRRSYLAIIYDPAIKIKFPPLLEYLGDVEKIEVILPLPVIRKMGKCSLISKHKFDYSNIIELIERTEETITHFEEYNKAKPPAGYIEYKPIQNLVTESNSLYHIIREKKITNNITIILEHKEWDHGYLRNDGEWSGDDGRITVLKIKRNDDIVYEIGHPQSFDEIKNNDDVLFNIFFALNTLPKE